MKCIPMTCTPVRYMPMRYTSVRCTPPYVRCTSTRYTSGRCTSVRSSLPVRYVEIFDFRKQLCLWPGTGADSCSLGSVISNVLCSSFNFSSHCDNVPHDFTTSKMGWFNSAPAEAGTPSSTRRPYNSKYRLLTCSS
jgi:hypothetical protein